jgi:hypothetical protein
MTGWLSRRKLAYGVIFLTFFGRHSLRISAETPINISWIHVNKKKDLCFRVDHHRFLPHKLGRRNLGVIFKLPAGNLRWRTKANSGSYVRNACILCGLEKWPSQYEAGVLITSPNTLLATAINDHAALYAWPTLPQMHTLKLKRSTVR